MVYFCSFLLPGDLDASCFPFSWIWGVPICQWKYLKALSRSRCGSWNDREGVYFSQDKLSSDVQTTSPGRGDGNTDGWINFWPHHRIMVVARASHRRLLRRHPWRFRADRRWTVPLERGLSVGPLAIISLALLWDGMQERLTGSEVSIFGMLDLFNKPIFNHGYFAKS